MLNSLMASKDFLALTLAHIDGFTQQESFMLGKHTKVTIVESGIIQFEPVSASDKDIVLSSGIHGNETAPIELCNKLIAKLLKQELITQQRLLFIFGNPTAIFNGTRVVDENLNRLFSEVNEVEPGDLNSERKRAKYLEDVLFDFYSVDADTEPRHRIHYDFHTAIRKAKFPYFAIYPYQKDKSYSHEQLAFLQQAGVSCVLFHHEPTTTFSYFSSNTLGADAFTIELGQVLPMGQNDLSLLIQLENSLMKLITGTNFSEFDFKPQNMHFFKVCRSIVKQTDDFSFTFANDVENFTRFPKNTILGHDGGLAIKVTQESEAIVFPNAKVPVGQRALICLTEMTLA